jgi:hypothetical protein
MLLTDSVAGDLELVVHDAALRLQRPAQASSAEANTKLATTAPNTVVAISMGSLRRERR